jgi:hypothetical protein
MVEYPWRGHSCLPRRDSSRRFSERSEKPRGASHPLRIPSYRRSGKWDEEKSVETSLDAADTSVRATVFRASLGAASMSASVTKAALILALILALPAFADIIDRIAVSVGNRVIAVSDLDREIRVAAFLDGVQPDFSPAAKRATAERMIEQKLIRRELETSRYPVPDASEVEPVLAEFREQHFKDDDEYRRAVTERGITEQDVKDELLWQRTLLRFIEVRFRPAVQVSDQEIQDYFEQVVVPAARVAHPGEPVVLEDYRSQVEEKLSGQRVDKEVDTWLKESRKRNEIVIHEDALQ